MFSPEMLNKKVFNRELRCEEQIKQIKEPLLGIKIVFLNLFKTNFFLILGLNYIIEFQFENLTDQAQYICELCHCKCSLQSILPHIISIRHQRKFLVRKQTDFT